MDNINTNIRYVLESAVTGDTIVAHLCAFTEDFSLTIEFLIYSNFLCRPTHSSDALVSVPIRRLLSSIICHTS